MRDQETRIAVLRRVDGLFELTVERCEDGPEPVYKEHLRPLLRTTPYAGEQELLDAWDLLRSVRETQQPVLDAVCYLLAVTVMDPEGERPTLERLHITPPPPSHKPTAANPRAYQGTKDRPPKPKRPPARDLRPFLCVPGGQDRLVQLLTAELGAITVPHEERTAPPGFHRGLAWSALLMPERFDGALAVHHALDLERHPALRHATAVFARGLDKHVMNWLRVAARLDPMQRVRFVELVAETGAQREDPDPVANDLVAVAEGCTESNFETRMQYALTIVANGDDPADLLPALEYADLHALTFNFQPANEDEGYHAPVPPSAMQSVSKFFDAYFLEEEWNVMHIWRACCMDPALPAELEHIAEAGLNAEGARALGRVLADAIVHDDADLSTWKRLSHKLRKFVAAMRSVPFQEKAAHLLWELVWEDSLDHLDCTTSLVPIVCVEPFAKTNEIDVPLERFGQVSAANQERLLNAGVNSFRVLDEESARTNAAWLISCGFDSLVRNAEDFFSTAFQHHPRILCRTSRTLGLLAWPQRHAIVKQVMASPLALDVADMRAPALVALFDRHGPKSSTSPIPKKLRQHLAGEIALSAAQLDRAAAVVRGAWPAVLCAQLQELTLAHMARNLGTDQVDLAELNDQMLHALKLQADIDNNQRGIRRLLLACHQGDESYLQQHPRNQGWLQQHADIANRWLEGTTLTRDVAGHGTVTLSIEHNPLEALRMGTYVGSCLGLGGDFSWSAAAIVLDINKHVVFARDADQRFLARQVIACTDEPKLACYSVHPTGSNQLQQLFRDFDGQFAEHLGIDIATDDDDADNAIALLVANKWWNDGIWTDDD